MNQILKLENNNDEISNINYASNKNFKKRKNKISAFLKIQFIISNIITIILIYYFVAYKININKHENISQKLVNEFNISSLYNSTKDYSSEKLSYSYENNKHFYVIGLINIPKINITYPIISEMNNELLKIAPCKFYGPSINEIRQPMHCCTQL